MRTPKNQCHSRWFSLGPHPLCIKHPKQPLFSKHPRLESNGDHEGRSPMLYPLSYAGKAGAKGIEPLSPESESDALTIMLSASITTGIRTQTGRFVAVWSIH